MQSYPLDFAAAWRAYLEQRPAARLDPAADNEFWQTYAPSYDERVVHPGSYEQTLALLRGLVQPADTLLDVGAGTGRFALPLARAVRQVTAVDQSAAMLDLLAQKAAAEGLTNLTLVNAEWPAAVAQHDVVLAAWSLYRLLDLRTTLAQLVAATRRTLVIVGGGGTSPPHRPLVEQYCGSWTEAEIPTHLYIAGTLWQLGFPAEVRVLHETRLIERATPVAVAAVLAPLGAASAALAELAAALGPLLTPHAGGWRYRYTQIVGVVIWQQQ